MASSRSSCCTIQTTILLSLPFTIDWKRSSVLSPQIFLLSQQTGCRLVSRWQDPRERVCLQDGLKLDQNRMAIKKEKPVETVQVEDPASQPGKLQRIGGS